MHIQKAYNCLLEGHGCDACAGHRGNNDIWYMSLGRMMFVVVKSFFFQNSPFFFAGNESSEVSLVWKNLHKMQRKPKHYPGKKTILISSFYQLWKLLIFQLTRFHHSFTNFDTRFFFRDGRRAKAVGGLKMPRGKQQSQIILLAWHEDRTTQGQWRSHYTWSFECFWAAFRWM